MTRNQTARLAAALMAINALLAALKLTVGLFARSGALTSDGVDSAGDVLSALIAVVGHPHGRPEVGRRSSLWPREAGEHQRACAGRDTVAQRRGASAIRR